MKGSVHENRKNDTKALLGLLQRCAVVGRGGETPSESESSRDDEEEEEEEEGKVILHCSPLSENLPLPGDLFGRQMGAPTSAHWAKRPWVDAYGVSSLPLQPDVTLVCSILLGTRAFIAGARMTYLPGALQVPLSSPIAGAVVPAVVGSSLSDGGGVEPLSKNACPWSFLPHLPGTCVVQSSVACCSLFRHFGSQVLKETLG
jgi:hypothetical protein